jgi:hypothetical protein
MQMAVRDQLEKSAQRYHHVQHQAGASEHKHWNFPNCPAEGCKAAREALAQFDAEHPRPPQAGEACKGVPA